MHGFKSWPKLVLIIILSTIAIAVKSQPSLAFYSFNDQFNSFNYNPAFLTSPRKFTFSIAPMGGTTIGYNGQAIIKDLLTQVLSGDPPSDEYYRRVLENMVDKSMFNQNIESTFLSFTYRSRIGFLNFRIRENESFSASTRGELTKFILKDGAQSATIDRVQNFPAQAIHYREYSLGYSYTSPMNNFSVGVRAKLYFGKALLYSTLSGSIIKNAQDQYFLSTSGAVNLYFPESANRKSTDTPVDISKISGSNIRDYLLNSSNPGFGIDFGINYKVTPKIAVSMSVIDLGRIVWDTKTNFSSRYLKQYQLPATSFKVTNTNGLEAVTKDDYKYSKDLSKYLTESQNPSFFSTRLPYFLYGGIKYLIKANLTISFTDRYVVSKGLNYNSISAAANVRLNKNLLISTGYSIIGDSYFNLPIAIQFKGNFGQIFFGTDNMAAFILPSISDFASFSFGTCFYLFKSKDSNRSASAVLPFYNDKKTKKNRKNGLISKPYPDF